MSAPESGELHWFKARASTSGNGCVEIAHLADGGVAVRHSRKPDAEVIRYTAFEWDCFLDGVKSGEFDRPGAVGD
ncbi:DUF397 domain-containing protein [Sphaerisporangium sp. NPDC049002]|uniref:DUF397 domain-containing protein n=1 Tax=unclassified Sphaerisporangium TaxID=2630420 RepID=UPI0034038D58